MQSEGGRNKGGTKASLLCLASNFEKKRSHKRFYSDVFAASFGIRTHVSGASPTPTSLMLNAASDSAQRTSTAHSKASAKLHVYMVVITV